MQLNSLGFLFFLGFTGLVYFAIPSRFRWVLLLLASYIFYASAKPAALIFLVLLTLMTYSLCLLMDRAEQRSRKNRFFSLILLVHVGFLVVFKYYDFFSTQVDVVLGAVSLPFHFPKLHLLLPVGISFYTFKSLGYSVDVYRGRQRAESHLGYFAAFVAFSRS